MSCNPLLVQFLVQLARIEATLKLPHPHASGEKKPQADNQGGSHAR